MKTFKEIIEDICKELDIKVTIASKGWMIILEKDNQVRYILGNKFDLNTYAVGSIFDDKYATYQMLLNLNIPVAHHEIMFAPSNEMDFAIDCNSLDYAYDFFERNNRNIVIKANNGSQGKSVYHVTDKDEIKNILDKLFISNYSISLCPFYNIKSEYRIIMLDGKPELTYKKIKPIIVGNGKDTIKELLTKLNPHFFVENEVINNELNTVLKEDEVYEYNWQFNLSGGATMTMDIPKDIKKNVESLAITVSKKINLKFASVDVIELDDDSFMILEINCGVATSHFNQCVADGEKITKEIYKKAIIKMFDL